MKQLSETPFIRYLSAKKTVDDRALNRQVLDVVTRALPKTSPDEPLTILEIGAGIGTMIERLVEWGLLNHAHYTALDFSRELNFYAAQRLKSWAASRGIDVWQQDDRLLFSGNGLHLVIEFVSTDLYEFMENRAGNQQWKLILANAFLDLVDLPTSLPLILSHCHREGLFYFTINYDGLTILEPEIDPVLDDLILSIYNLTMDQRRRAGQRSGDSRTGRHLITHLSTLGAQIFAAGSSDWIVFSEGEGYPGDEAFFLHYIIDTIYWAVHGNHALDPLRLEEWKQARHRQIDRGILLYIAHQIDIAGKYVPRF